MSHVEGDGRVLSHAEGDERGCEASAMFKVTECKWRQYCSRCWEGVRGASHVQGDVSGVRQAKGGGRGGASAMYNVMGGEERQPCTA